MAARDKYHQQFREVLENDGWTITHDPYFLEQVVVFDANNKEIVPWITS